MDEAASSALPRMLRVLAKARRALPEEPMLWTVCEDAPSGVAAGGEWRYRMVLELADTHHALSRIGAPLIGDGAETFFAGVPPVDLRRGNASLHALRQRVARLCDDAAPAAEFCLWAFRPPAAKDTSAHGIAYHIVWTTLLAK